MDLNWFSLSDENKIHKGDFSNLSQISTEDEVLVNLKNSIKIEFIYFFIQNENYEKANLLLDSFDSKSLKAENVIELWKYFIYSRTNQIQKIDLNKLNEITAEVEASFYRILAKLIFANIDLINDNFDIAKEKFIDIINTSNTSPFKFFLGYSKIQLAQSLLHLNEIKTAVKTFDEALKYFSELNNTNQIISVYNNLGYLHTETSNFKMAIDYYKRALELSIDIGNSLKLAILNNNLGIAFQKIGELDNSLKHYYYALDIFNGHNIKQYVALIHLNLGTIYDLKGDYPNSIENYQVAIEKFDDIDDYDGIIKIHYNIALLNLRYLKYEKVKQYLDEAIRIIMTEDNHFAIEQVYCVYLELAIALNDKELGNKYINLIDNYHGSKLSKHYINVKLAKANYLLKSDRLHEKGVGISLIREIVELKPEEVELYAKALIKNCQILIDEYKSVQIPEILDEIEYNLERLNALGLEKNSLLILVDSMVLKSDFYLFRRDYNLSKKYLVEAQSITKEKGLEGHSIFINQKLENFNATTNKVKLKLANFVDLIEDMGILNFEELIKSMNGHSQLIKDLEPEKPAMLLILSASGLSVFSHSFELEYSEIGDQLLAGYISAISSALQEAFKQTGMIERLKHQDHTILLKPMENYVVCYVLKGTSYFADEKINQFISDLRSHSQFDKIIRNFNIGKIDHSIENEIANLAKEIFVPKNPAI